MMRLYGLPGFSKSSLDQGLLQLAAEQSDLAASSNIANDDLSVAGSADRDTTILDAPGSVNFRRKSFFIRGL
ncbi:hypothetical protein P879_10759 [Paragonimus westermani]|uniref:Uncharacterized protein n=1 Tax=Paragonimus westermani TaxID=34504 RepID=A0A8T0DCP2_9TREM|nr:hypothetical protein P879_10759 [Paragonimus westermani]